MINKIHCRLAFQCFILIVLVLLFSSCGRNKESIEEIELKGSGLTGNVLAIKYCSSCHTFPNPNLLTASIWKDDVLPSMGHRMGIYEGEHQPDSLFEAGRGGQIIRNANIFPEKPILAKEDWQKIIDYYVKNAPDTILPPVRENKIKIGLKHFKYKETTYSHWPPLTTMIKILPEKRGIVFGDGKPDLSNLTFLKANLDKDYNIKTKSTPIHYYERADTIFLTTIGNSIYPHDSPDGAVQQIIKSKGQPAFNNARVLISDLQRPVYMEYGDLNNDGLEDIVACEFGNNTGKLVWYQNNGHGQYSLRPLKGVAGAIKATIKDMNNDGLKDVVALMAQGDEGIFWFKNRGNGTFEEIRLLTFLPLYGSQYFELLDFNKDGYDDILYVCGDNADSTPILKSYHGIYIYLNDGQNNFTSKFFYPLNGAYKAIPNDYDLDGDLDIAAISFFPDYRSYPKESFVYLENKGGFNFVGYSFPQSTNGRWIVMDAGDLDGDGDIDLALGSFVSFLAKDDTTGLGKKWYTSGPSIIVLENTIR